MIPDDYFDRESAELPWGDCIELPPFWPLKDHTDNQLYTFNELADAIFLRYKDSNKKIVYNHRSEGFVIDQIHNAAKMFHILSKKYDIPVKDHIYVSGCLPINQNFKYYEQICQRESIIPIKMISVNHFEILNSTYFNKNKIKFNSCLESKGKKFISMNGVTRPHRTYLTGLLLAHNLFDEGYYSYTGLNVGINGVYQFAEYSERYSDLTTKVLLENRTKFPCYINKFNNEDPWHIENDIEYFNNARFNIICETNFYDREDGKECFNFKDVIFFTEKTFRSIGYSCPFILLNRPYSLKSLQDYGYKTFHPFINEDYDTIENDDDRLYAAFCEIQRLCSLSNYEWAQLHQKILPILEYNYNKLINARLIFAL